MIKITGNVDNVVYYSCSCGIMGRCATKPLSIIGEKVVRIECPHCEDIATLVINTESNCDEDTVYSLSIVLDNTIFKEL